MRNCMFCDIANGKVTSTKVYEDELIVGFMDIDPLSDGHVLLITKEHRLDLDELTDDESTRIMQVSKTVLKALRESYDFGGYCIMQNGGAFNDIGHYHLHIFPRYNSDGFAWTWRDYTPKDTSDEGRKLKAKVSKLIINENI